MRKMMRSRREVEVKLPYASPAAARERLGALGVRLIHDRKFEENVLFDRESDPLGSSGRLLRLRRYGEQALLTFKAPVAGSHAHKAVSYTHLTLPTN